jgi:hypothetical protein
VLQQLPAASQALLLSKTFFPNLISVPFDFGLRLAFSISVVFALIAAVASALRGGRYIYEVENSNLPADQPVLDPPAVESENKKKGQEEKVASISGSSH